LRALWGQAVSAPVVSRGRGDRFSDPLLPLVEKFLRERGPGTAWQITARYDSSHPWIIVRPEGSVLRNQGWKLHVSANVQEAVSVLSRVLPTLVSEKVSFKLADSLNTLRGLNEGEGGFSQVGKFITIYPYNDAQAVHLAIALDAATRGLSGPIVPSDRAFSPGSLVYYRYGAFDERYMQTALGLILPVITTPNGTEQPDLRRISYLAPEWAIDPFVAAGAATEPPQLRQLIGERYHIVAPWHWSPRNLIYLGMDIMTPRSCVLKRARLAAASGVDGLEAPERLRREAMVLRRLAGDDRFPAVFDVIEQDGDTYLAMEDVEGSRLEARVAEVFGAGRTVPTGQIITWGRELASALSAIHQLGIVHRDLKSPNVIVAPDGRLRLIDFDSAVELSSRDGYSRGTGGYASPQQESGEPPNVQDDIYSLGALLFFVSTGAEPSIAPESAPLLVRPLSLLNPALHPELAGVIANCLNSDPSRRFGCMEAVDAALSAIDTEACPPPPHFGCEPGEPEEMTRTRACDLAYRLGQTFCRMAQATPSGRGLLWASRHPVGAGIHSRDINTGSAGAALALAEIVDSFDDEGHRESLRRGAEWLLVAPPLTGPPLPGLYVGEAGIGTALLRAGQVLDDLSLISAAARRGAYIASLPHRSPDLFNGTAGRLRFHLFLWDATQDAAHLRAAVLCGEALLAAAHRDEVGARWIIPDGYADLSSRACLGYAHGAAGIADTLLDLFEATQDDRYLACARDAGEWLLPLAVATLDDRSGLDWPEDAGAEPNGTFLCRGASGIGRFFLHAAKHQLLSDAAATARSAARTVARGARWINSTQCHGLSGNIEFLLDAYQATADPAYLNEARSLARLLEAFATERDGLLVWPSEPPWVYSPDYMVGYAGVAVCLLRLAQPELRPAQLTCAGFRYRNTSDLKTRSGPEFSRRA
jgi:hypothetical protein